MAEPTVITGFTVELPFPSPVLWPNGRTLSKSFENRVFQQHKAWADIAVLGAVGRAKLALSGERVAIAIGVRRKAYGVFPDDDNCVAAAKAYLDGIAQRIGVNDRLFTAPVVTRLPDPAGKKPVGAFIITVGSV